MRLIVAIDIGCNKRRYKINKRLLGFGERAQYSIFELDVSIKQLFELQKQIAKLINPNKDKVNFYPLCGKCMGSRKADGIAQVTWPTRFYVY